MTRRLTLEEASQLENSRHVLGISGGKDSAALAIYLRDHYPEIHKKIEYFFTDTGAELDEVYKFLDVLEAYLGKEIKRLSPDRDFHHWLKVHNNYLPSPRQRWCTLMMKIKPFEAFVGSDPVVTYIGIRADENREGYVSQKDTIQAVFPFIEDGLIRSDIFKILEDTVGIPEYYRWRSRSGCYFCFFQRQDEWLGLKREHPDLFAKAALIEKESGQGYTWVQGKTLEEVVAHAEKREKEKASCSINSEYPIKWQDAIKDQDDDDPEDQSCIICSL